MGRTDCDAERRHGRRGGPPDVTRSERDLVTALRDELAAIDPSRPCDVVAEVDGLGPEPIGRGAWLRGRFLARGSLSLAGGRTHLEFVVPPDEAPVLAARLAEFGLPVSWR